MPVTTFSTGTKIATEVDRGTAPSSAKYLAGNKAPWWMSGKWFDIITDGLPSLQDQQAIIFPSGYAGARQVNQQPPVLGRRWSEGEFQAPVTADFLGLLLYAAMGGLSSNMVPGSNGTGAPSLLNNESINTNPKSLVLAVQPDGGGNIIRFDVKGTVPAAGMTISISGIDSHGQGASELIAVYDAGLHWTRTSWSSIAASGVAVSGVTQASMTMIGVKRYVHTFTTASSAPTLAIERAGTPTAGNTASKSHMHVGMSLRSLTLETPAAENDGIFMVTADFEGDPTATCNSASLNAASPMKIWPAWTLAITSANGASWYKATDLSLTINAGNKNYMAAAGVQGPQGRTNQEQSIEGQATFLLDSEEEYNNWRGASKITLLTRWNTPWKLDSSFNYELSASLPIYVESLEVDEDDGKYSATLGFRTVVDANHGMGTFSLTNGTPGRVYDVGQTTLV